MSLLEKLKKNSKITGSDILADSEFFSEIDITTTEVIPLNIALSGEIDGGLSSGILTLAGPSKSFKTSFALLMASAYLKKHADAALLFYDSEFGSPQSYFSSFGIDTRRVLHTPVTNLEQLKFDLVSQLEALNRNEKLIIIVDSIGNIASKKEVDDALTENAAQDMTRAKVLKGIYRMITPYIAMKNIPFIGIAHSYKSQEKYSKDIIGGGTGIVYASNACFIIGRQQDQDKGDDGKNTLNGYNFIINVEKSRFVKEKSKIPISVSFAGGIEKYSGLLELALEGGFIIKPKVGWYQLCDPVTKTPLQGSFREADTYTAAVWAPFLKSKEFQDFIKNKFKLAQVKMLQAPIDDDVDELEAKPPKSFKEKIGCVSMKTLREPSDE